jgi:hypothetical protein
MRLLDLPIPAGLAVVLLLGAACASRSGGGFTGDGDAGDAGGEGPLVTDSASADTTVPTVDAPAIETSAPAAQVRLADWSPDAPSSGYDVCVAPHGTSSWSGPLLAQELGDAGTLGDAREPALQFPAVTNYLFALAPGPYDVAVVEPGGDCTSPVAKATELPSLAVGSWYTMAIIGDRSPAGPDPALSVLVLTDDSTASNATAVRFLDVAPSIASADFGEGTLATGFVPLAIGVPYGEIATMDDDGGMAPDPNGYVVFSSIGSVTLSAHASAGGASDLAVAPNQSLGPGTVATVALVGGKTGGPPPQLVVCTWDGVVNESSGLLSSCVVGSL